MNIKYYINLTLKIILLKNEFNYDNDNYCFYRNLHLKHLSEPKKPQANL